MRGILVPEQNVRAFLDVARGEYADGASLLEAAADHFDLRVQLLASEVERFKHVNCGHPGPGIAPPVTDARTIEFARDVTLHVVLHELGHALLREFDLPTLANEEALADAFATHYLTTHLPERAFDVLTARTRSFMIEARQVPREDWSVSGEHDSDARRAYQVAALAVAADPDKYTPIATAIRMPERDIRSARDYGTEVHRSWRRILQPLWMPNGVASNETRFVWDTDDDFMSSVLTDEFKAELSTAIRRFDWHSQVTLHFAAGEGGAGWNRSKRTITVHSEYVQRFVTQGRVAAD